MTKELEALEALEKLMNGCCCFCVPEACATGKNSDCRYFKNYKIIETALKDYKNTKVRLDDTQSLLWEKNNKLQILEVIIKKRVNIELLGKCKDSAGYNQTVRYLPACAFLTTHEFEAIQSLL